MAAVLCLVMLPTFAAVGVMLAGAGDSSLATIFALATFTLLAAGLFVGAFNMARGWDDDGARDH